MRLLLLAALLLAVPLAALPANAEVDCSQALDSPSDLAVASCSANESGVSCSVNIAESRTPFSRTPVDARCTAFGQLVCVQLLIPVGSGIAPFRFNVLGLADTNPSC